MLTQITENEIDAIAAGATVLGTGGGGDPLVGSLIAKRAIREHGPVTVLQVDDLPKDGVVTPVGMIGAPSVSLEKISAAGELLRAIQAYESATGKHVSAVMPIEVGGGNSLLPIAAAAETGLPLVDADAMGRAFPEGQMVTFHLAGYGPGTTVMTDSHGNGVVTSPVDGKWSERIARAICSEMGGSATMIDYAYPGDVVQQCAIPQTLTMAFQIGEILQDRKIPDDEKITHLLHKLDGYRIFRGKVTAIERAVVGGFTRGEARLEGFAEDKGSSLLLNFQNEMLLATKDGELAAVTPDLICVLDDSTGIPITTESLRYGARATIIALPCNERWRTDVGIETAGPRYFGYDTDFVPVEELAAKKEHAA